MKVGDIARARKDGRVVEGRIQWLVYADGVPQIEMVLGNGCMVRVTGRDLVPTPPVPAESDTRLYAGGSAEKSVGGSHHP